MKGILVIGHGSRSEDVKEVFFKVVDDLRKKTGLAVEGCFMELCEPDINNTIKKMYINGIREITAIPYFLFNGIHIKEDIPDILKEAKKEYDDLNIFLAKPIEYDSALIDILLKRAEGEKTCI
ncbi:MAG: CbiX/SirB N-terminal domain-containing protein [Caloramator sp.]|nr:CbiX/SirB N-terminal domain-containing protein [Caloramator sp.]